MNTCKLEEVLADYSEWIRGNGFCKNSPKDHILKLVLFWKFLEKKGFLESGHVQLLDIDRDVIADYQAFIFDYVSPMTGKKLSCNSQINALSYLMTFFRFLEKTKRIAINPTDIVRLPRHPHLLPAVLLKPDEMRRLLDVPNVKTVMGFRDRTIMEVLWTSAPRASELCSLTVEDINFEEGMLVIREGKGQSQRVIPLGNGAIAWLREYLANVRPLLAAKSKVTGNILFLNRFGRGMQKAVGNTK